MMATTSPQCLPFSPGPRQKPPGCCPSLCPPFSTLRSCDPPKHLLKCVLDPVPNPTLASLTFRVLHDLARSCPPVPHLPARSGWPHLPLQCLCSTCSPRPLPCPLFSSDTGPSQTGPCSSLSRSFWSSKPHRESVPRNPHSLGQE